MSSTDAAANEDARSAAGKAVIALAGCALAAIALLALLDWLGAPDAVIARGFFVLALAACAAVAGLARVLPRAPFGAQPVWRGLSIGADAISAPVFLSLAGAIFLFGYDGLAFGLGLAGGYLLLGLLVAPRLAASGAHSLPSFFARRYGAVPAALAVLIGLVVTFILLVASMTGGGLAVARLLGIDYATAVAVTALSIVVCLVFGGLRQSPGARGALYLVMLGALLAVIVVLAFKSHGLSFPLGSFGDRLADVSTLEQTLLEKRLADARTLRPMLLPFLSLDPLNLSALLLCLMAGIAAMPHVAAAPLPSRSNANARRSVAWALLFVVLFLALVPDLAVQARFELLSRIDAGTKLAELPGWVFEFGRLGLVQLCGADPVDASAVAAACSKVSGHRGLLRLQDVTLSPDGIALLLPEIAGLPALIGGFFLAGALVAAVAAGEAILRAAGIGSADTERRADTWPARLRLSLAFLVAVGLAAGAAVAALARTADMVTLLAWSCSLAAAGLFPALIAGLWWRRANAWGAVVAMLLGFGVAGYYIAGTHYFAPEFYETWSALSNASGAAANKLGLLRQAWLSAPAGEAEVAARAALDAHARTVANWWGIKTLAAGIFGLPVGFLALWLVSIMTPATKTDDR